MPERRGSRFVVEALFLAALTVALALAHLDAIEIVGAMALGWIVVAAIEWAAWRGEPHYGSGLPPRYYLPRVDLPPPQPLEQVDQGYPDSGAGRRADVDRVRVACAPRCSVSGRCSVLAARSEAVEEEEPEFVDASKPGADPWTVAALPVGPLEADGRVVAVVRVPSDGRKARYSLDPLGDPAPRRRFGRARSQDWDSVEVAARPRRRPLPGAAR